MTGQVFIPEWGPKEKARAKRLADYAHLTPDEWEKIHEYQGRVCFLCGKSQKSGKRLATDHDHATGLIRGLLCSECNRLLGKVERLWTISALLKLIEYRQTPPATAALGAPRYGLPGCWGTKKSRKLLKKLKKAQDAFNVPLKTAA